ncbi:MAG: NADH-quinone oxidoreductase subunit M [Candidatus Omnitrophica bacterium]|nr:NADH-quinone oxidoreductase subunit M [Candidatus Omnitrophota bacterium]
MTDIPILSIIVFLPLLGAVCVSFIPGQNKPFIKLVAFLFSFITFLLSVSLFFLFNPSVGTFQFMEFVPWISSIGANYSIGIDGISLFLLMLTTFLTSIAILYSFRSIGSKVKEFMIFMLFLNTTMLGVFVSLDMLLFYLFWEAMLIPMYFLIGIWGGERRVYATMKFFLYTMFGSVLMLAAILYIYFMHQKATGISTFDLQSLLAYSTAYLPFKTRLFLFLGFAIAFAIKVPLFPFHTWLPDAYTEAPIPGNLLLAGILVKMGVYGFLRFAIPFFPEVSRDFFYPIGILAVIGIIYGALIAYVQKDMKKLIAYSSFSQVGFIMLGIFSFTDTGMTGGVLQMINHGLSISALFLLVGMLYDRTGKRGINDFGGLSGSMPVFSAFLLITILSSIGLPGLNGFVGEFLILLGVFKVNIALTAIASTGIILSAIYMLWMFQKVSYVTPADREVKKLPDLSLREILILVPIILMMFWLGLYPKPFLSRIEPSVKNLITVTAPGHFVAPVASQFLSDKKIPEKTFLKSLPGK